MCQMTGLGSEEKLTGGSDGLDLTRWNLTGTNACISFYAFVHALPPCLGMWGTSRSQEEGSEPPAGPSGPRLGVGRAG